ncbi:30S ribosomal protein S2 [Agrobacterium vitis]|uniref:30S ribosomal protein S2 n=1 Tax=Agrobacterium vitis TaxID=373 RepID=UPI003D26C72C
MVQSAENLFSLRSLRDAGVHWGHKTKIRNPKMDEYIFGTRDKRQIIDLSKTVPLLRAADGKIADVAKRGGDILFVGTKKFVRETIRSTALVCRQHYVDKRWLGGTLTNWNTIRQSVDRLNYLRSMSDEHRRLLPKHEVTELEKEERKLEIRVGGIANLRKLPDLIVIVDSNKEHLAVREANRKKIPVIGVVDTDSSPEGIDYIIPGNDDGSRAIRHYCAIFQIAATRHAPDEFPPVVFKYPVPDNQNERDHGAGSEDSDAVSINAWLEADQPSVLAGKSYSMGVDIGGLRRQAQTLLNATDIEWGKLDSVDLTVVLSGRSLVVKNAVQQVKLERGDGGPKLLFNVKPLNVGNNEFKLGLYLSEQLFLLHEFKSDIYTDA